MAEMNRDRFIGYRRIGYRTMVAEMEESSRFLRLRKKRSWKQKGVPGESASEEEELEEKWWSLGVQKKFAAGYDQGRYSSQDE